jgi:hypothetical protein
MGRSRVASRGAERPANMAFSHRLAEFLISDDVATRKRRWHFSILNLLLLATIVALSVTVGMLYRTIGPMRQELMQLRNEVGTLRIEDPTKLHAVRTNTHDELEWKWRIWVPEGKRYRLHSRGGPVPEKGYPRDSFSMTFGTPGEHVIRYRISYDPRDGVWYGYLHMLGTSVRTDEQPWVKWPSRSSTSTGIYSTTKSYDQTDQPMEIFRFRVSDADGSQSIPDPAAGFMIWLQPD